MSIKKEFAKMIQLNWVLGAAAALNCFGGTIQHN